MISITGPRELIERFKEDIKAIDRPLQQVLIQAIVTRSPMMLSRNTASTFGLQQRGSTNQWKGVSFSSELGEFVDTLAFRTNFLDYGDLLAQLRLLESEKKAEIKANPKILVNDRGQLRFFWSNPTPNSDRNRHQFTCGSS